MAHPCRHCFSVISHRTVRFHGARRGGKGKSIARKGAGQSAAQTEVTWKRFPLAWKPKTPQETRLFWIFAVFDMNEMKSRMWSMYLWLYLYIYTCIFRCFTSRHEVSWLCCTFLYAHSAKAQICHIISLAWDEGLGHTFQICFHKIWIEDIDPDRCQKVKKKRRTSRRLMPSMLLLCVVPRDLKL